MQPVPQGDPWTGSLILDYDPLITAYEGVWVDGINAFDCIFIHDTTTGISHATATWSLGPYLEHATWPEQTIPLHPNIIYNVYSPETTTFDWRGQLTITG